MKSHLKTLTTWLWGALYAAIGGAVSALSTYYQNVRIYTEVDWDNVRYAALGGAVFGVMAYVQKERKVDEALYTLPPDGGRRARVIATGDAIRAIEEQDAKAEKAMGDTIRAKEAEK